MRASTPPGKPHIRRPVALFLWLALLPVLPAAAEETPVVRTLTISAVGDCTLGRNYQMLYAGSWDHFHAETCAATT